MALSILPCRRSPNMSFLVTLILDNFRFLHGVRVHVHDYLCVIFDLPSSITSLTSECNRLPKLGAQNPYYRDQPRGFKVVPLDSTVIISLSCTVSEIQPSTCPKSLYLASTPIAFNPPTDELPWDDFSHPLTEQNITMAQNGIETTRKILTG